jgi:hypothetical protein
MTMPVELTEIRRSQIVTTFGPGGIADVRAGRNGGTAISVIIAGLDAWDESAGETGTGLNHPQTISEPRLQKILGVGGFRLPPVVPTDETGSYLTRERLPGVRFPSWLHCPECHMIKRASKWQDISGDAARYCAECGHRLGKKVHVVPVRFISCCENGHIDEFPWWKWLDHKGECKNRDVFKLESQGAGLSGIRMSCRCGASRSMDGCFGTEAFKGLRCSGSRPWLGDKQEGCDAPVRALLRGASNVYFPALASSLDIPPWADRIQRSLGAIDWNRLAAAPHDQKRLDIIRANDLADRLGMTPEDLLKAVTHRLEMLSHQSDETIRYDEFQAFLNPVSADQVEFEVRPEVVAPEIRQFFSSVISVKRLREVRAIRSFTRIRPPADWRASGSQHFADLALTRKDWLPAIEVRGEGVFLQMNAETLAAWEARLEADDFWAERLRDVNESYRAEFVSRHGADVPIPRQITLRFMMIHSLAHTLMRQLALSSGYSAASLRERLYCDDRYPQMNGLLIYTASPDADGTLGGLSRQARPLRILEVIVDGIQSMRWCSSDPLCIEGVLARSERQNPAACHSCLLAPETSCEEFNRLLDRALLVGTPERRVDGFFSPLLNASR